MKIKLLNSFSIICIFLYCTLSGNAQHTFAKSAVLDSLPSDGFYQVNLLPALTAYLQADMRDLRLVDKEGKQVPYIIKVDAQVFEANSFTALPILSVKKEKDRQTHITIENTAHHSIDQLLLMIKNTDAGRWVTLSGSDDNKNWFVIKEQLYLTNITGTGGDSFMQSLSFPLSSYQFFNITIIGKDVLPVNVLKAGIYRHSAINGRYFPVPAPEWQQKDSTDKYSYVSINFNNNYFIDNLTILLKGPKFFHRQASIYLGKHATPTVQGTFIISSDKETILPLRVKTNQLILRIKNDDNPPLHVEKVDAGQLRRYLLTYLEKENRYQLFFEDSVAETPTYDLGLFTDSIAGQAVSLHYGNIESHSTGLPLRHQKKLDNKGIIWMAIGFAVTILLLLTYKLTKEIKNKQ